MELRLRVVAVPEPATARMAACEAAPAGRPKNREGGGSGVSG